MQDAPEAEHLRLRSRQKIWLWSAVDSHLAVILRWVVSERQKTFRHLWGTVRGRSCFLDITDGYPVYPCFINDCVHLSGDSGKDTLYGSVGNDTL
jgi:IS1 family transposase